MPTMIDGKQATYDGVSGLAPTPAQAAAIEAMLFDFDDMATLGDIDFMTFPIGGGGIPPIIENGTGSQTDTGNAREVDFDDPFEAAFGAPRGGPYFLDPWGGVYSLGAASACASADTMLEDFWKWIKRPDFDWTHCEFQEEVDAAKAK